MSLMELRRSLLWITSVALLAAGLSPVRSTQALDVVYSKAAPDLRQVGRVLVEAQDGGILFQDRTGAIATYQPDEIDRRETTPDPFEPLDADTIGQALVEEFGPAFRVHKTEHYVVVYDTHPVYAKWTAGTLEKLHGAFYAFWKREKVELSPPEFPLPVLLFRDKPSYTEGTRAELGEDAGKLVSFYSLKTNRVYAYDVTETSARTGLQFDVRLLRQPAMLNNVTNIVHESTHQVAFNSGLQRRFAGHPLWWSEGLATYFEAPDFSTGRGWRTVGTPNLPRLIEFRKALPGLPAGTLEEMLKSDASFRDPAVAAQMYAQAWTFIYWAFKHRSAEMTAFAQSQQELPSLSDPTPEDRIAAFEQAFGKTVAEVEQAFLSDAGRIR
jgi:hypothetical protein